MPIDIDESCIVGWAERYYRENPTATKGGFLGDEEGKVKIVGEIREPKKFKGLINPYMEETNEKFKYLMDCLNDRLKKKDLGAFYTPMPYARKAAELVQMAVNRAIEGGKKDYIVLDRAAGCGVLESALVGLYDKNGDEVISHAVISTYEYYEYKVLNEILGDRVRDIIPPTEEEVVFDNGVISNADAMSEDYVNNPIIKQYVDDEDCAIIMFENPPYADSSSSDFIVENDRTKKAKSKRKTTFVAEEFKKGVKKYNTYQASAREFSNLFIWSAFEYYLRQKTDAYIIFSPVKYFKSVWLVQKEFKTGFAFNRKHFHATESVISCVYWENKNEERNNWELKVYDIDAENNLIDLDKTINVKKVFNPISRYADLRADDNDKTDGTVCASDGSPIYGYKYKKGRKPLYNKKIIGYLTSIGYAINAVNYRLTRSNTKTEIEQSFGFHLRSDNYLKKLPVWCAKLFPQDNWYDKDVYFTTSDGGDAYTHDNDFLKSCLIYTNLSNQNKCLSFTGSDGRYYKNELCFDEGTLSSKDLEKFQLDKEEEELISLWNKILNQAKSTKLYKKDLSYGVYQITKELNTFKLVKTGTSNKKVYDYPELNGNLETLRVKLKEYYKSHITDKMFQYELIK